MTTPTPTKTQDVTFTRPERRALQTMRRRYRQDRDLFSTRERERLSFWRWLYSTGRVEP